MFKPERGDSTGAKTAGIWLEELQAKGTTTLQPKAGAYQ